jgi:hypothetical protein
LAECTPVELLAICATIGLGSEKTGSLGQPIEVSCESY